MSLSFDDEEFMFGAGDATSNTNTTSSNNRFQHATSSTSSSSSSINQNRRVGNVQQNSRVANSGVGIGIQLNAGSLDQSVDLSILENEQSITVTNWVDKILLEAFRSTNSTKRLTENIKKYEKKIESDGLLPIKEDLKDIKGKTLYV